LGPDTCLLALNQDELAADAALLHAEQALEQAHADPRWALVGAMALWKLERYSEAFRLHQSYQHHLSGDADAWVIAGMCARRLPDHRQEAEQAFLHAIALNPGRSDSYYNLGNLYNEIDRHEAATEAYRRSLAIDSLGAPVWHNLGISLRELERLDEAKQALQISLQLNPLNADVWCNLGLVAHAEQQFELAKRCYLQSIQLDEGQSSSWVNLGMSLLDNLKPEEALPVLQRGQQLNPSCPEALFNLALTLLLLGDYPQGWRLYESRFRSKNFKATPIPSGGPWISSLEQLRSLASTEQPCLIWSEQGIGDCIQFVRYLPILQALEIPFVFATRPSLVPLFRAWGPHEGISIVDDTKLNDSLGEAPHLPLLSLPRLLGTDLCTIPAVTPYLKASTPPPEPLLIQQPPGGIAIGIVWASNPGNKAMYRNKSMPLMPLMDRLLPAVRNDLCAIHSLQVGKDAQELTPYLHLDGIHDWSDKLKNFSDTAHLINQLDLLISVDTGVVHLAGALAIPTWILLPSNADFRWLRDRNDSPWYDMVRLFRQRSHGCWSTCIDAVIDTLGEVMGLNLDDLQEVKP
jgi:tetratricopeptide (TPR) repeat protein